MRKIYSLLIIAVVGVALSCKDDALDPLKTKEVTKGNLLSLRGKALNDVYVKGLPIAEVFPKIISGTETLNFDAEYLSNDPASLQSVDIFVTKRTKSGSAYTSTRVLLTNVPFSSFISDGKYPGPWVSVTLKITDVLAKLGLSLTTPNLAATLLADYKFGIVVSSDLNLTNGSIAPAANLVAPGLFQSNQFYPAQLLNWAMTDYCSYDATSWAGKTYDSQESPGSLEDNKVRVDPSTPNRFIMDNFWGDGVDVYFDMNVSVDPGTQTVKIPTQTTSEGGVASGTGTYNQCLGTMLLTCKYVLDGSTYNFTYTLSPK